MCYFVEINLTRLEMQKRFGAEMPEYFRWEPMPFVSGFSFPSLPVVLSESKPVFLPANWGLIPSWVKDAGKAAEIRTHTLNAKSETVHEKPSFRNAFASHRCILPVTGFFEWHHNGKEKYPFYIRTNDSQPFALAGILDRWTDRETGEIVDSFAVCTTAANGVMSRVHNTKKRMPAILPAEAVKEWLNPGLSPALAREMLRPYAEDGLRVHPIARFNPSSVQAGSSGDMLKPVEYEGLVW